MIAIPTDPSLHIVFDLLGWSGGLGLGVALYRWRLKALTERVASRVDGKYFGALVGGAVGGAWLAGSLNTLRAPVQAFSHSVAGALVGAIVAVEAYKAWRGIKGSTGGPYVGSFALGIVIGRFGCLMAGLPDQTYGIESDLPWAVDLGDGIPRHPVQLYESAAMALFLLVYLLGLRVRAPWAMRRGFYVMCAWYGAQRFLWEFLKPYPTVIGPFNLFHLLSAGLVLYGSLSYLADSRRERRAESGALSLPGPDHVAL